MTLKIATKLLVIILWISGVMVLVLGLPVEYCALMWAFPVGRSAGHESADLLNEMFD